MSENQTVDIQPTPNVLLALTRTPITPIDALCELIDNSLDSFRSADVSGGAAKPRHVIVDLPGITEVARGEGLVRIRDTGPGLTLQQVTNALKAGFSSKNAFDTLGLFGMGFNIATGKLGRQTTIVTAAEDDDMALQVELDLPSLIENESFEVPTSRIHKPHGMRHGTIVEIRGWWPDKDPNNAFIRRLAATPRKTIREQLARRYATLLRRTSENPIRITVNDDTHPAFEHCVWGEHRFVERAGRGRINARIVFDEVLASSVRCIQDGSDMGGNEVCLRCGGRDSRMVEERVKGWVGVQRFDDQNEYGIDLIRNGRAIRVQEKSAFFENIDEDTKKSEREYPVDQQYGRIVGEVHLDHVPVDFTKQDFQRTSDEWHAAMEFLRGKSLLPSRWPEGYDNTSPVSQIFQGYRKVRNFGTPDMYMGEYNPAKGKADRVARSVEREYLELFKAKVPGYYDDEKWWELVVRAGDKPIDTLPECPECQYQNAPNAEMCEMCGHVLDGKACLNANCTETIPRSAIACPTCGASQVPEVRDPWKCNICDSVNPSESEKCERCDELRGAPNPSDPETLALTAERWDDLSIDGLKLQLADGSTSSPIDLVSYLVPRPIVPKFGRPRVPVATRRHAVRIEIYFDRTHPAFADYGMRPEDAAATELAHYMYERHPGLIGRVEHSPATLMAQILQVAWGDDLAESPETVKAEVNALFALISEKAAKLGSAPDFYGELDEGQQGNLASAIIASGADLTQFSSLKQSGEYLTYADLSTLVGFFRFSPAEWFTENVWSEDWPGEELGTVVAQRLRSELTTKYQRCLEDCASYVEYRNPERLLVTRAKAAVDFLSAKLQ
ncbi:hypothetical protein GIS00_14410 [Nakamurella sp. YIM 132087]|uniref:RanBP2-type domain-containing protein n=1 Tax=Nakamurella alba TaxID=2665158 RepID=A0A7K1FPI4_9ACTN|nr:ATP-binding protein [Nakamurella alba]MTD15133.1 hypothetical protein [Nakamurella alba]